MSASATQPGGTPQGDRIVRLDDDELTDILQRLQIDAELFGDGAATYEAGVLDTVEAIRALVDELDDGNARN